MTREELIQAVLNREEINTALADTKLSALVCEALAEKRDSIDEKLDALLAAANPKPKTAARGFSKAVKRLPSQTAIGPTAKAYKMTGESLSSAMRRLTKEGVIAPSLAAEGGHVRV